MVALTPSSVSAQLLFQDTFDRADSWNVDGATDGITDNTGVGATVDGVYLHGFIDPNNDDPTNGPPDNESLNGAGVRILSNELELSTSNGTSNVFIDRNFTNASILAEGGFSVSVDVTRFAGTTSGQGGGFAIGMTKAQAEDTGDALNGLGSTSGNDRMQDGIAASGNEAVDVAVSDFWLLLRGNGTLIWGGAGNAVTEVQNDGEAFFGEVDVGAKTGTIKVQFLLESFGAASRVFFEIFFDGVSQGSGTFLWDDGDANYIGLDTRDFDGVSFDNLTIVAESPSEYATLYASPSDFGQYDHDLTTVLSWMAVGAPPGATYRITANPPGPVTYPDTDDTGSAAAGSGTVNAEIAQGTSGNVTFLLEILDGASVVLSKQTVVEVRKTVVSLTGLPGFVPATNALDEIHLTWSVLNAPSPPGNTRFRIVADKPVDWLSITNEGPIIAINDGDNGNVNVFPTNGNVTFTFELLDVSTGSTSVLVSADFTVVAASLAPPQGTVLFADSYDRPDETNISASATGMSGSLAPLDYLEVFEADPANPVPESIQILSNKLQAATGFGMSLWSLDHNFVDAAILSAGGFSVALDVAEFNTIADDGPDRYAGFGVGLTLDEVNAFSDEEFGQFSGPRGAVNGGSGHPGTSDFYISLSVEQEVQILAGGVLVDSILVDSLGEIRADFGVTDFNRDSFVAYRVYHENLELASGYFRWSNDNANYLGFSGRSSDHVTVDNLSITEQAFGPFAPPTGGSGLITNVEWDTSLPAVALDAMFTPDTGVTYRVDFSTDLNTVSAVAPGDVGGELVVTGDGTTATNLQVSFPWNSDEQPYGFTRVLSVHWPAQP